MPSDIDRFKTAIQQLATDLNNLANNPGLAEIFQQHLEAVESLRAERLLIVTATGTCVPPKPIKPGQRRRLGVGVFFTELPPVMPRDYPRGD